MKELLRSNDPVLLSYVSALLEEGDIGFIVLDTNMSVLEGSIGAFAAACLGSRAQGLGKRAIFSSRPASAMFSPTMKRPSAREAPPGTTSTDDFLGGRIGVIQPRRGHRAGSDAVFLAASVPARAQERVFDVGAGVGVAGLCLLARVPGIEVTAVEIDAGLSALAVQNAARNGFAAQFKNINADVTSPGKVLRAAGLERESYHHLIANPPFHSEGKVRAAPDSTRAAAHVMGAEGIAAWMRFFAAMAAPNALLTLIHRPDCLAELLGLLQGRFGDIAIFPLFSKAGPRPRRALSCRPKKGSRAGLSLLPGLLLHEEDGSYTAEAESVLRGGAALDLGGSRYKKGRLRGEAALTRPPKAKGPRPCGNGPLKGREALVPSTSRASNAHANRDNRRRGNCRRRGPPDSDSAERTSPSVVRHAGSRPLRPNRDAIRPPRNSGKA